MKKYRIPVEWFVSDFVEVVADNLEDAVKIVKENEDIIPLGTHPEYINDSYHIDDGNLGDSNINSTCEFIRDYFDEYGTELTKEENEQGKGIYVDCNFIQIKKENK